MGAISCFSSVTSFLIQVFSESNSSTKSSDPHFSEPNSDRAFSRAVSSEGNVVIIVSDPGYPEFNLVIIQEGH
jgi:hypothetical protein